LSFEDLQDKISQPIIVSQSIKFHKSLIDRFIDAFKEEVNKNPFYETTQVWKFYCYSLFLIIFLLFFVNNYQLLTIGFGTMHWMYASIFKCKIEQVMQ